MNKPTTREILDILYKHIEERKKQHCEKGYAPGKTDVEAQARFSECGIIQAIIVGLENEHGL